MSECHYFDSSHLQRYSFFLVVIDFRRSLPELNGDGIPNLGRFFQLGCICPILHFR